MRLTAITLGLIGTAALAGCDANGRSVVNSDTERALVGAAAGAVISDATGGKKSTGAIIGATGGAFCDDFGLCGSSR